MIASQACFNRGRSGSGAGKLQQRSQCKLTPCLESCSRTGASRMKACSGVSARVAVIPRDCSTDPPFDKVQTQVLQIRPHHCDLSQFSFSSVGSESSCWKHGVGPAYGELAPSSSAPHPTFSPVKPLNLPLTFNPSFSLTRGLAAFLPPCLPPKSTPTLP